ncbi:unnamed protein product [Mytilus edulis]|uniref:Ion transport domain-containing protein n=1 Tax=Mytilus edulis TaxID=6550 RepID=A0A8S3VFA9_MYTED|nr:unnamed protein product [Mytilus edulis]
MYIFLYIIYTHLENKQDYEIIENILKYADLWDRPDIAEKEVFNLKNSNLLQMIQGNKDSILSILFKNALVDKKRRNSFLQQNLKDLYVLEHNGCYAGEWISKMCERDNRKNIVNTVNGVVKKILGSGQWKPFKENEDKKGLKKKTHDIYEGDIFKHLFIWAVLIDRRNLAMIFWKKENNDYICSALYASSLAKKLAEKSSSESFVDQRTDLWESSRQYEDLAYNVMTELYCKDKNRARTLLMTEVEGYNYTTILEIAEKFSLMKFMGHAACQTRLDKIWKGEKLSYTSNVKAITAAFMPMLIMCLVKIHDNKVESTESPDTSCQHEKRPNWMIIYHFYNSPRIKFVFHLMAYMVMIVMFCLFILTDLHPMSDKNPSIYEYMVYAMAGSLMIEEIRQAFVIKQMSRNLMTWFSFWTLYEIVMYSMFLTSVFLRLTLSADKFYHTRMMYAITLGLFIVNGMQFFLASKHIGPKVIMIGRMMYDILFFILIFAVFVFGFGVVYQATMYPNSKLGFQLFKEIIYMPYWQLYGELFLPEFEGKEPSTCSHDVTIYSKGNIARCPEVNQINTLLLAIYMVVTHIILVNILIAMFSNTFTKVQNNNELVWKFHRYSLVQEYYDKSMLIPPLIILSHMVRMVKCIYLKCRGITHRHNMFSTYNVNEVDLKLSYYVDD